MKPQSNSPGSYDDSAEPVYWWALAYGPEEIARWLREVLEVKPNPIDINGCLIQASRCEGSNPSILSKILKPFTIEEIDTLFSLEIEWNKHPLYFATHIKILSLVFQKTSEKWKKEIVGSCLYKECVARALLKNNSPCVSFLLERISESYRRAILQSVYHG